MADQKLTALTEDTTPSSTDIIYSVKDPSGTPLSRKVAHGNLAVEGTSIKSTGEAGGTKFLREDGDGTCSWQAAGGGGGGLSNDEISPTTANITLTANTRYFIDASGLTADRALVFPSASDGDQITLVMVDEDPDYACVLEGDTGIDLEGLTAAEWDRLWNTGQAISFTYLTGDGWRVTQDSRTYWRNIVLTGTQASLDFQNIPPRAKDIAIDFSLRSDRAGVSTDALYVQLNGDTGSNYSYLLAILAHSASFTSAEAISTTFMFTASIPGATGLANQFSIGDLAIPRYAGAVGSKMLQSRTATIIALSTGNVKLYDSSCLRDSTAAINRVRLYSGTGNNFIAGSSVTMRLI